MVYWWFIEAKGEYATKTKVGPGNEGPVIPVLELIEEANLNQLTGDYSSLMSPAESFNKCSPELGHGEPMDLEDLSWLT